MTNTTRSINLLRNQEPTFADKLLKWALTGGRFLVILTETIALIMFLYRFDIDRQLIDLHDTIKQKQPIIANFSSNETNFRNLQTRIALAKKLSEKPSQSSLLFQKIVDLGNNSITFTTITVSDTNLLIEATTPSTSALTSFVKGVKADPIIESLSIDKIENKTSTATIAFGISGKIKKEK